MQLRQRWSMPSAVCEDDNVPPSLSFIVIGGGLGGVATSIALTRAGHRVTVLEAQAEFQQVGAGIQVHPNGNKILQKWGLLDQLRKCACPIEHMNIRSYKTGGLSSRTNFIPSMEKSFGTPQYMLHRADLLKILLSEARRLGVTLLTGCRVVYIDLSVASVRTEDGRTFNADVVVGADGERSLCRSALMNCDERLTPTGKLVYRFTIPTSLVLKDLQLANLTESTATNLWMGPDTIGVCYELRDRGILHVVVVSPDPQKGDIQNASDLYETKDIVSRMSGWDPLFIRLLEKADSVTCWPILQNTHPDSWTHAGGKFILIGDAAHAMPPYLDLADELNAWHASAQGANQAFEDAALLGELFSRMRHQSQTAHVLDIFQRCRRGRVSSIHARNLKVGRDWYLPDGEMQRERDRQLMQEMPFEGFSNPFADPVLLNGLYGYDLFGHAERAWTRYLNGDLKEKGERQNND